MVKAEIPLWVIHSSASAAAAPSRSSPSSSSAMKNENGGDRNSSLLKLLSGTASRCAIYSIDYHPSCTRFVTAGGDGLVRIWNAHEFFLGKDRGGSFDVRGGYESSASEKSDDSAQTQNRLLSTLSSHTGSVLCVRFSNNGKYLASAGDDAHVLVYAMSDSPNFLKGNLVPHAPNIEHWNRVSTCRGHNLDAVGLAWSPDDTHLVSCSLDKDSPIIVWKMNFNQTVLHPHKILGRNVHKSMVKGVAFDPIGKYLASSGDDPRICFWRCGGDWGLEKQLDGNSGIFQPRKSEGEALTSLSLFRRLSFSPDGAHVCVTNGTIRGKNVAAMVSRQGWKVSQQNEAGAAPGAANLVGHKQPVVCSRHCPLFFSKTTSSTGDDKEPNYSLLLALGDKRGFITIWSTAKSRPILKLQCSERRCSITDLAWGRGQTKGKLRLLVSMLDGHCIALEFETDDLGTELSQTERAKIFRLKYGIESSRDVRVGDHGPKLIENTVQFALEEFNSPVSDDERLDGDQTLLKNNHARDLDAQAVSARQVVTTSKFSGKKRIRPVLLNMDGNDPMCTEDHESIKNNKDGGNRLNADHQQHPVNKLSKTQNMFRNVHKAATDAESITNRAPNHQDNMPQSHLQFMPPPPPLNTPLTPNSSQILSIDLPFELAEISLTSPQHITANVTNTPSHTSKLTISQAGSILYTDILPSTITTSLAASTTNLVLGSLDGSVYIYSTSPSTQWGSGIAYRSHPVYVFYSSIVTIQIKKQNMLLIGADGTFALFDINTRKKNIKGTVLPSIHQMQRNGLKNVQLTRAILTDTNKILVLLSGKRETESGDGVTLEVHLYDPNMELWQRLSDDRFVLSEFFTTLPCSRKSRISSATATPLEEYDSTVRRCIRVRSQLLHHDQQEEYVQNITRSHCEDRMACALAFQSLTDFDKWWQLYCAKLAQTGDVKNCRILLDRILEMDSSLWWLHVLKTDFKRDKRTLLKILIEEMGKNRALQRFTSEIVAEIGHYDGHG